MTWQGPGTSWATAIVLVAVVAGASRAAVPQRGLTAAEEVKQAYDVILDADFERVPSVIAETCGPAPRVACLGLEALSLWWQIQLDPTSRALDARFSERVEAAIEEAARWTGRDPERAEAWFYLGAALGVRGQWRVLREQRLAAARDGKRIKEALDRALAIDPDMDDAAFGTGVYRYYASVAPAYLRWLRWLLLLPGGDRAGGLADIQRATVRGQIVKSEAAYQLHVVYLWYEQRARDALDIILVLQARYPHNPLFRQAEAEIRDAYFHDPQGSLAASESLLALAERADVHRAEIAAVHARLNMAVQLDRLGRPDRARAELDTIIKARPSAPNGALARAERLRRRLDRPPGAKSEP